MRTPKRLLIVLASPLVLSSARAQKDVNNPAPMRTPELAISYDLIGSNAPAGKCGCFVLNGGSATGAYPLPHGISAVGQFSATRAGHINGTNYDLTLLMYTFGFRYTPELHSKRVSVFAQGLIGGATAYGDLVSGNNPGASNAGGSLAGSVGGGMDVRWKRAISVRALEVSYQPTSLNNGTSGLQNNYRISAGLVFHFPRP